MSNNVSYLLVRALRLICWTGMIVDVVVYNLTLKLHPYGSIAMSVLLLEVSASCTLQSRYFFSGCVMCVCLSVTVHKLKTYQLEINATCCAYVPW